MSAEEKSSKKSLKRVFYAPHGEDSIIIRNLAEFLSVKAGEILNQLVAQGRLCGVGSRVELLSAVRVAQALGFEMIVLQPGNIECPNKCGESVLERVDLENRPAEQLHNCQAGVFGRCVECGLALGKDRAFTSRCELHQARIESAHLEPAVERRAMAETVNHPTHYGGNTTYEAIKVIEAWGLGFCLGNAVKYICRAEKKGSLLEDLKKARWYIDREISRLEGEQRAGK